MINERIQMKQDIKSFNISEEVRDKINIRITKFEDDMENEVSEEYQKDYEWQIEHIQNLTGTKAAYDPSKSKHIKLESYSSWRPKGE